MSLDAKQWLLRIEAVNLGSFITDSDDLSTIRGAGLLVLGIHQHLTGWSAGNRLFTDKGLFRAEISLACIDPMEESLTWTIDVRSPSDVSSANVVRTTLDLVSAGASIAIYRFFASKNVAEAIRDLVSDWLRNHELLKDATFAVAVGSLAKDENQFVAASENVVRTIRRRQLRAPTVSIGDLHSAESSDLNGRFCDIDGKRAATIHLKKESSAAEDRTAYAKAVDKNFASSATAVRRRYGRDTKIRVYHMIGSEAATAETAEQLAEFTPTWELHDIAVRGERRVPEDKKCSPDPYSKLSGKIAVIYIDGNKFSQQIRHKANTLETYRAVDRHMLRKRRILMRSLVDHMRVQNRPYWRVVKPDVDKQPGNERFRIETLMWGGDELVWVVPAWCGLETVRFFFDHTKNWTLTGGTDEPKLTHAVGMVLCSHKSPIRSVVSLAKELAESAKQTISSNADISATSPFYNEPSANCLAYQVLESFDHLGSDFDAAREKHRFASMTSKEAVLSSLCFNNLIEHMNRLKHDVHLPRTRLHQLATLLKSEELPSDSAKSSLKSTHYGKLTARISETVLTENVASSQVLNILNDPLDWGQIRSLAAKWYHVVELWDYLSSLDRELIASYKKEAEKKEGKA